MIRKTKNIDFLKNKKNNRTTSTTLQHYNLTTMNIKNGIFTFY